MYRHSGFFVQNKNGHARRKITQKHPGLNGSWDMFSWKSNFCTCIFYENLQYSPLASQCALLPISLHKFRKAVCHSCWTTVLQPSREPLQNPFIVLQGGTACEAVWVSQPGLSCVLLSSVAKQTGSLQSRMRCMHRGPLDAQWFSIQTSV